MNQPTASEIENAQPRPDVMEAFAAVLGGLLTLPEIAPPTMVKEKGMRRIFNSGYLPDSYFCDVMPSTNEQETPLTMIEGVLHGKTLSFDEIIEISQLIEQHSTRCDYDDAMDQIEVRENKVYCIDEKEPK